MAVNVWKNDGISKYFGTDQGKDLNRPTVKAGQGTVELMVVPIKYDHLTSYDADANNDGTLDSFSGLNAAIPAGAMLQRATVVVSESFTVTGTADVAIQIGLAQKDGDVIDADGIDANLADAALEAGDTIVCDGALVGKTVGSEDAYVMITNTGNTATTGGKANLLIEYITKTM